MYYSRKFYILCVSTVSSAFGFLKEGQLLCHGLCLSNRSFWFQALTSISWSFTDKNLRNTLDLSDLLSQKMNSGKSQVCCEIFDHNVKPGTELIKINLGLG